MTWRTTARQARKSSNEFRPGPTGRVDCPSCSSVGMSGSVGADTIESAAHRQGAHCSSEATPRTDESVRRVILIGPRASCALIDHERAGCARSNDHDRARLRLGPTGWVQPVFDVGNLTRLHAVRRLEQARAEIDGGGCNRRAPSRFMSDASRSSFIADSCSSGMAVSLGQASGRPTAKARSGSTRQ